MVRSKSWNRSWLSLTERRIDRPALLTRKSIESSSLLSRSARSSIASRSDRSHGKTYAVPPRASIAARVASSLSLPRATSTGMPPAWATLCAVTWPMPEEAPVITTVLPLSAATVPLSLASESSSCSSQKFQTRSA